MLCVIQKIRQNKKARQITTSERINDVTVTGRENTGGEPPPPLTRTCKITNSQDRGTSAVGKFQLT